MMPHRVFRARTFYLGVGVWWLVLVLLLAVGADGWLRAGSTASLIWVGVLIASVWVPLLFAIWQAVHWTQSRPSRTIEKRLGIQEEDTAGDASGDLPTALAALSVAEIRNLANYRTLKKALVRAGGFSFAFSALAVVLATRSSTSLGGLVLVALALLLLQHGLWLRRSTNPIGLVTGGLTIIALGLWTMGSNADAAGTSSSPLVMLGVWQIAWGGGTLRRFDDLRLRRLGAFEPNADALVALDDLVTELSLTQMKSAGGIVFTALAWRSKRLIGRLTPHIAVFTTESGDDVYVGDSSNTSITSRAAIEPKADFNASLAIGDHSFKGTVSARSFARYEHWKSRAVARSSS